MDALFRLQRRIADLDIEARKELAAAVAAGRFDDLSVLMPPAKEIAALAERWCANLRSEGVVSDLSIHQQEESAPAAIEKERKSSSSSTKPRYPTFLRQKNELVKLGWSEREKRPYEHRVSKKGVDAVLLAIANMGRAGYRFTMEEIIRVLKNAKGEGKLPSYQIYVVVSWLKWAGMVLQHGRQGYTVIRPQTFAKTIEIAWKELPQR